MIKGKYKLMFYRTLFKLMCVEVHVERKILLHRVKGLLKTACDLNSCVTELC